MKGIMKDAFLLFVITLVAGACLGAVHEVTLEPIAKAQLAANTATYKEVFPEAALETYPLTQPRRLWLRTELCLAT